MIEAPLPWKSPRGALAPALRAAGVALHARLLFEQLPDLRRVTEALAWHITDRMPFPRPRWMGPAPSLLQVCLKHAFEQTEQALNADETDPDLVSAVYLRGLFYALPEVVHVRVTTPAGHIWAPLGRVPLSAWPDVKHGLEFEPLLTLEQQAGTMGLPQIRATLLTILAPPELLARLGSRVNAIVAGT